MDKGIRAFALTEFVTQNALRRNGEKYTGAKGNTEFRKAVMAAIMENFGCSLASAATSYNEAFKSVRAKAPETVMGLGRAEDKKGGRKTNEERARLAAAAHVEQRGEVIAAAIEEQGATPLLMAEMEELA